MSNLMYIENQYMQYELSAWVVKLSSTGPRVHHKIARDRAGVAISRDVGKARLYYKGRSSSFICTEQWSVKFLRQ
jgi:hypothetical protein